MSQPSNYIIELMAKMGIYRPIDIVGNNITTAVYYELYPIYNLEVTESFESNIPLPHKFPDNYKKYFELFTNHLKNHTDLFKLYDIQYIIMIRGGFTLLQIKRTDIDTHKCIIFDYTELMK